MGLVPEGLRCGEDLGRGVAVVDRDDELRDTSGRSMTDDSGRLGAHLLLCLSLASFLLMGESFLLDEAESGSRIHSAGKRSGVVSICGLVSPRGFGSGLGDLTSSDGCSLSVGGSWNDMARARGSLDSGKVLRESFLTADPSSAGAGAAP